MKIGFCANSSSYNIIKKAGYDFIEMPVNELMPLLDTAECQPYMEKLMCMDIPCTVFNCFIPGNFSIIQSYMEGISDVLDYSKVAIKRVARFGGKIIVFGSGTARNIPPDIEFDLAMDSLIHFMRDCADYAKRYQVTIAVEHLNRHESNVLNTVKDVDRFVEIVNRENVKILFDSYHFSIENEDITDLDSVINNVAHIHISDKEGRSYPHNDIILYSHLNKILKKSGYNGDMSVECSIRDLEKDAILSMDFIKNIFATNIN